MRYILLITFLLLNVLSIKAQNTVERPPQKETFQNNNRRAGDFIDVNAPGYLPTNYDPLQLVKDVLISTGTNSCVAPVVSNVTVSPNLPVGNTQRSWGYFHRGTTSFPFKDGIILSTGYVNKAGNTAQTSTLSDNLPTNSDPDLVAATNPSGQLNDAVILEFDFVPTSSQVKFNYLFGSEEYTGSFPCSFSDAFALLLKPAAGGPYVNMAVLPNGAGPVSVTNIHPSTQFGGGTLSCGPANEPFFAGYNTAGIETNFNGRTIPLTATATVVPGQLYHFKMVLADALDSSYDSVVFLEGGSFDIGIELLDGTGTVLPNSINVCDNTPTTISSSLSDPNLNYQWFLNGTAIAGATNPSYTIVAPGVYKIEVMAPGSPCPGEATITVNGGTTPTVLNANFKLCSTPDFPNFDLNATKPLISTTPNAVFYFYENQADAVAQNTNFIQNINNYNGTDGQILYVLVSNGDFCSAIAELTLNKEETPVTHLTSSKMIVCKGEPITLTATGGVTYEWINFMGNGNTQTINLEQSTTFTVYAIGAQGCKSLVPATIRVEVVPAITSPLLDVEMCIGDSILLDAGAGNNYTYLWSTGETTQTITATELGIYSVMVNNGVCEKSFIVQVVAAASPFFTNMNYEAHTLTVTANTNPTLNNIPVSLEYSLDGTNWQDSNVFTGLVDNTNYNVMVRIKNTHCIGALEYFTVSINNIITPNNDGINDVINLSGLTQFNKFTGSIYDRYGTELFRFSKLRPTWNGSIGGKRLSTGTYWYKFSFEYKNSKTILNRSGWIMLKNRD